MNIVFANATHVAPIERANRKQNFAAAMASELIILIYREETNESKETSSKLC